LKPLTTDTIFKPKIFEVKAIVDQIYLVKKIPPHASLIRTNIEQSLSAINYSNAVIAKAYALKATTYDSKNEGHEVSPQAKV